MLFFIDEENCIDLKLKLIDLLPDDYVSEEFLENLKADCVGSYSTCNEMCVKTYSITRESIGSGEECPAEDGDIAQCQPGEGLCSVISSPSPAPCSNNDDYRLQRAGTSYSCTSDIDIELALALCTDSVTFRENCPVTCGPCQNMCTRPADVSGYIIDSETDLSAGAFDVSVQCAAGEGLRL